MPEPLENSQMRTCSAVVFDFDGVIVDTEVAIYEGWQEIYGDHGVELPLELYVQCVGSDHKAWDPKSHLERLVGRRLDWEKLLAVHGLRVRAALAEEGVMPGVLPWLEFLKGNGIPCAVASSSSRNWVGGWLGKLGLAGWFEAWHCRDDVERIKPAPDLFLRAAAALGVDVAETLVIEDSANGLHAALAAGCGTLVVPNRITAGQDFTGAHYRARSLADGSPEEFGLALRARL